MGERAGRRVRGGIGLGAAMLWASSIAIAQVNGSVDAEAAGLVSALQGDDAELVFDSGHAQWEIRFEPAAWFVSPAGKLRLPGTASNGSQIDLVDLGLDNPRVYPFGELHIIRDRWRITLGGAWLSNDATVTAKESGSLGDAVYSTGDSITTGFTFASFQALGAVRVYDYQGGSNGHGGFDIAARVELTGGVRFYVIDIDAKVAGSAGGPVLTRTDDSEFFAEPVIGVKATIVLLEEFSLDTELTIGGFAFGDYSVYSIDVIVGGTWHPTPNLGLQIGYRQLAYFLKSGDSPSEFEYNGTLAGLYGGLDLRF